jgi:hypothetical protein
VGNPVGGCDGVSPAEGGSQADGWWAEERHPPAIHGSVIKNQKKRMRRRHTRDDKGVSFAPFSPYFIYEHFVSKLESAQEKPESSPCTSCLRGPDSLTQLASYSSLSLKLLFRSRSLHKVPTGLTEDE